MTKAVSFVFPPRAKSPLSVEGSESVFPVNRIYCVGRNYAEHAREMGDDPQRDPPFFFCKDASCVVEVPWNTLAALPYPSATKRYEYEVELVVALGKGGKDIALDQANEHIFGYAIGLDMTRRDLQSEAKQKGRPWEVGKSFDGAAPMSPIIPIATTGLLAKGSIALKVDGEVKQISDLEQLTWSVAEVISRLSQLFELHPGDLIMTGTPENVGPIDVGQTMEAHIESLGSIQIQVVAQA